MNGVALEIPPHEAPQDAGLKLGVLAESDAHRWDCFVKQCPQATFFHRAGWRSVLETAFGHDTRYLYAERNGEIQGVLPLGHINSRLFGNALMSTPFCAYGGVATESDEVRRFLEKAATEQAQQRDVDYLELRDVQAPPSDWPVKDLYFTFRRPIDSDPEANLRAIPRKQRAIVRKGIKAGLKSEIDDRTDRFFSAYSESVRNLGTPVFSRRYFEILKRVFGDDCEVLTVTRDGRTVCSVMSFYFRDEVLPYYGGGTGEARQLKGNDFMYWEVMRRACERGFRIFDYGRSKKGTGSFSFKKNWGFEPQALPYRFHLVNAREIPNVSPMNPKYRLLIAAWKRLPLGVANRIGPVISRNLG